MRDTARRYLAAGLCVLPARRDEKRPIGSWKPFRERLPTETEVDAWFANEQTGLCILTGKVSGNHELIDFDQHGALFDAWCEKVREAAPGLLERLVISKTQNDGRHVAYRSEGEVSGNLKLAQRREDDGKIVTLIETRGEGGLYLCAPTPGYEVTRGDLCNLPLLTEGERDVLLHCARELNEYMPPVVNGPSREATSAAGTRQGPTSGDTGPTVGIRPGDDFSRRGDVRAVLEKHGWRLYRDGENQCWSRPGKTSGTSATLRDGVFFVFSTNAAPLEPDTPYSPFAVYTLLEHGGSYEQAARALRADGYGSDAEGDDDVDLSGIVGTTSEEPEPEVRRLGDLIDSAAGLHPPLIRGLLRRGETMNIIASPKTGKSWLVSSMTIAVAAGLDWLGLHVEQGSVLHIDNELHAGTTAHRYKVISNAMRMPHHLYSHNIDVVSLRGRLRDLHGLGSLFRSLEPGQYALVVIDAFYRTLPRGVDENDNGAVAGLYNLIDQYAERLGCAFVLVHHTSKGNQAAKSVTDVGAGAGSQSRAADAHVVLRPHKDKGIVVLESALRTWAPMEPLALEWRWPLFHLRPDVDPSALEGMAQPKTRKPDVPLEAFVGACVARHDPCSQRSVQYEAGQRFELPERKADALLALALDRGLVSKIRAGSHMQYVVNRPGVTGDKGLWVAALLANRPEMSPQEVAEAVGASDRYVRQIRSLMEMSSAELARNSPGTSSAEFRN